MEAGGTFVAATVFFSVLKLSTSIDDLIWLSPFLAISDKLHKVHCSLVYVLVSMLVSVEAIGISLAASFGLDTLLGHLSNGADNGYWETSRILRFIGASVIAAFGCREYYLWSNERNKDDLREPRATAHIAQHSSDALQREALIEGCQNEDSEAAVQLSLRGNLCLCHDSQYDSINDRSSATVAEGSILEDNPDLHDETSEPTRQLSLGHLLVVALFGTLDDLAMFASVMMGQTLLWLPLLCGSMMAASIIVLASWCLTFFGPFVTCIEHVPLWALLVAISFYLLFSGLVP